MAKPLKICICGGGNGAHVMAAYAASREETEVNVLTLFKDEAERWSKAIEKSDMVVTVTNKDGSTSEVKSKPAVVSKDPAVAVPGSDILILIVPAFAHEEYLKAVAPHIDKKTVIVGLPGQPGFEYQCMSLLGELAPQITIMSFETLPWACRITEFGLKVDNLGTKKFLAGSIVRGKAIPRKPPLMSLQVLHGFEPSLQQTKHFLVILFMSYSFVHPAILYGRWKDWDKKPLNEEPLFYQGIDEATAQMLETCSQEFLNVAHGITAQRPEVDMSELLDIYNWYLTYYKEDIEDSTNLLNAIRTNKSYKGLAHPMTKEKGKYVPNFKSRYLTEDIPMGMVVFKGVAEIVGVETPVNDMLLEWGQEKIGKKYLVDGKLNGPDVKETRCPQTYGLTTLDEILNGRKSEDSS